MPFAMRVRSWLLLVYAVCNCAYLHAQLPFYTDDTGVTDRGKWHFEFFNEYDALQLQYPNVRQNTANFKLNYGLPHNLELDVDAPYLTIQRTGETSPPVAWATRTWESSGSSIMESKGSRIPALGASFYTEFRQATPGSSLVPA